MRTIALLVGTLAAALAVAYSAMAQPNVVRLKGVVGPGENIALTKGGVLAKSLKRGRYVLTVSDRSAEHNFHLRGPGLNKMITSIPGTGAKSVTVTLRPGTYVYLCDPHASKMRRTVRVR